MQNWLFASGQCHVAHDFTRRERIDFAGGGVRAYMEETDVMPGVSLYKVDAGGIGQFQLHKDDPPGGRLILGCLQGGAGTLAVDGQSDQVWREDGWFYSLAPGGRPVSYDIHSRPHWRVVALRIEAEALDILGQENDVPHMVYDTLEGRRPVDVAMTGALAVRMRRVMGELLQPAYTGSMRRLYQQSKALELMAYQFDALGGFGPSGQPQGRELARLREARERLVADLANPPSLDELAAAVGLPPKRLNAGFRAAFGTTVFDYLRDARLDSARSLLDQGLDMPLKLLAWQVGYSQPSNFITAFRRRFGVSPGAYRRKKPDA
jgi:AraC-like DNA-binding protein